MRKVNLAAALAMGIQGLMGSSVPALSNIKGSTTGRKQRNPNSAESQYLIAKAEDKRERRMEKLVLQFKAVSTEYVGESYYFLRQAMRGAVDAHNSTQPVVEKGQRRKLKELRKNVARSLRQEALSLEAVQRCKTIKRNGASDPNKPVRRTATWKPYAQR